MRVKKLKIISILFILLGLVIACQKDPSHIVENLNKSDLQLAKEKYELAEISKKLNTNEKSTIIWEPLWDEYQIQKSNDSVEYLFIPLHPYLKQDRNTLTAERGGKTYLLIKNGKDFFKAFYFNEDVDEVITDIKGFTGNMLFKNLESGVATLLRYENGLSAFRPVKYQKNSSTKANIMAWEQNCNYKMVDCIFSSASPDCGGGIITIFHSRDCMYPSWCSGYGWNLTDYSEEYVCENIWVPDPPESPGGGGSETDANKEIIDSLQGYSCAQQVLAKLPNFQNRISTWMKSKFDNFDNDIFFRADINMPNNIDGTHNTNNMVGSRHTITLNGNMLLSASQEYIVATMYHEVLHAFLFHEEKRLGNQFTTVYSGVGGLNISGQMKFTLDHSEYLPLLDDLAKAIQEFSPNIGYSEALALAKGGVVTNLNTIEDTVNKSYKNGSSGTTCTP